FTWAPDYPWGQSEEQMRGMGAAFEALFFGSPAESAAAISWLGNFDEEELARLVHHVRQSASPSVMESIVAIVTQADVRKLLPAIQAPTLVIHGTEDALQSIEGARYVARQIPGARMLELPGE